MTRIRARKAPIFPVNEFIVAMGAFLPVCRATGMVYYGVYMVINIKPDNKNLVISIPREIARLNNLSANPADN